MSVQVLHVNKHVPTFEVVSSVVVEVDTHLMALDVMVSEYIITNEYMR